MKNRVALILVVWLSLLVLNISSGLAVTCPRGYDVDEKGQCYLETKYADETKSMVERCMEYEGMPPECCKPPLYIENEDCRFKNVDRIVVPDSPPDRPFRYTESRQIHRSVYECLKRDGPFDVDEAEKTMESAKDCLASGSCTLQRRPDSHNCGLQGGATTASQVWQGIAGNRNNPQGLVREAKDANNYAWYDFADASIKAAQGVEVAKKFGADLEAGRQAAQARAEASQKATQDAERRESQQELSTRFSSLESRATPMPWRAFDQSGTAMPEVKLEGNTPVLLKAEVDNIAKGQPFSQEMPKESLLQKAILIPAEPISKTEMTITLNAKPIDLKMPDPARYDVKSTFSVDLSKQGQEVHPLSEALFYIKQPGGKLLRYDTQRRDWTPLESQPSTGGFVAKSPGNSYFAIVVEKAAAVEKSAAPTASAVRSKRAGDAWFILAVILGIAIALAVVKWRAMQQKLQELRK